MDGMKDMIDGLGCFTVSGVVDRVNVLGSVIV